jgi:hypothetical protein
MSALAGIATALCEIARKFDRLFGAATVRERAIDRWRQNPLADARGSKSSFGRNELRASAGRSPQPI